MRKWAERNVAIQGDRNVAIQGDSSEESSLSSSCYSPFPYKLVRRHMADTNAAFGARDELSPCPGMT